MKIGDKVKLSPNASVQEVTYDMLYGNTGTIVDTDVQKDWVVAFPYTMRTGGHFALNESDLVKV